MTISLKIGVIGCGRVAQSTPLPLLARLPDVSLLDLTPTFLTLLNEPVPAELSGRPLAALLS